MEVCLYVQGKGERDLETAISPLYLSQASFHRHSCACVCLDQATTEVHCLIQIQSSLHRLVAAVVVPHHDTQDQEDPLSSPAQKDMGYFIRVQHHKLLNEPQSAGREALYDSQCETAIPLRTSGGPQKDLFR